MGPFDGMIGKSLKPLAAQKQKVHVQTVKAAPIAIKQRPSSASAPSKSPHSPSPLVPNGNSIKGNAQRLQKEVASRTASKEPRPRIKRDKSSSAKRSSPAVSTPRFDSDDSDERSEPESNKRQKVDTDTYVDTGRRIRHVRSSSEEQAGFDMIHAADVANLGTDHKPNPNYATFFTALTGDEDEAPVVELQYPGGPQRERYQMVQGKGDDDFKPLDEIIQVVSTVAEHYLVPSQAEEICDEVSGLLRELKRARLRGHRGEAGAQSKYMAAVERYSSHVDSLRRDGSIQKNMDKLHTVKLPLAETILHQIYARTVSPRIHRLRAYENGTDNVYGELLPKFCSTIFGETGLRSGHTFVDLGSGVGNVVLQAALQTGCASHGCEMMPNAADLATLQHDEFTSRCGRLWGLSPGAVDLQRGDFLTNAATLATLQRADVVLINNQAFTPALNDALVMHFLDLKDGCQVVSLKSFVPAAHKISARNMASPINLLHGVRELEYFSNCVSWTDAPGKWYVQVKDSGPVRRFQRKMEMAAQG